MKKNIALISIAITIVILFFSAGVSWANVNENTKDIEVVIEWIDTQRDFNEELTKITVRQDETLSNIEEDIDDIQEAM